MASLVTIVYLQLQTYFLKLYSMHDFLKILKKMFVVTILANLLLHLSLECVALSR